jgi:hypothetical protein
MDGKDGLRFCTNKGTPQLYGDMQDLWLTPRFAAVRKDHAGMGSTQYVVAGIRGFDASSLGKIYQQLLDGARAETTT